MGYCRKSVKQTSCDLVHTSLSGCNGMWGYLWDLQWTPNSCKYKTNYSSENLILKGIRIIQMSECTSRPNAAYAPGLGISNGSQIYFTNYYTFLQYISIQNFLYQWPLINTDASSEVKIALPDPSDRNQSHCLQTGCAPHKKCKCLK